MDKIPGACNQQRLRRRILYAHLFVSVNTQYYFLLPLPHCISLQYIISYWSLLPPTCLNCVLSPLYHICTSTIPPHHLSATDTESIRFAFKRITVVTTHGRDHSTISLRLHFVAVILVSVNALSINTVNYCKHIAFTLLYYWLSLLTMPSIQACSRSISINIAPELRWDHLRLCTDNSPWLYDRRALIESPSKS